MNYHLESRNLLVKLTDEEILEYSGQLAKNTLDLGATEDRKKEAVATFTATMKKYEAAINELSHKVSMRKEYREIKCEWHFNWEEGKKTLYRTDTGEQIESQPISDYDRQMRLEETGIAPEDADAVEPDSVETDETVEPCDGAEENHEDAGDTSSEDSASAE